LVTGCARSGHYYDSKDIVPNVESKIASTKAYRSNYVNGWYCKGDWHAPCQIPEGVANGVAAKFSKRMIDTDGSPGEMLLGFEKVLYEMNR
jgi:hypothetical protein